MSKSRARRFADIISGAEQVPAESLANASVTAISDQVNTSTGFFDLPSGTTAQRPASPTDGATRFNTESGSVEFYDGSNWISTNLIPSITNVTGSIVSGVGTTLQLNLVNATDTVTVKWYNASTLLTENSVTISNSTHSVQVPSQVHGLSVGSVITVQVLNQDGTPSSNTWDVAVASPPTGGTITVSGGYRYHKFTGSSSFSIPAGQDYDVECLIVAGGGGGGGYNGAAGAGAGGMVEVSGNLVAGSYTVVIGAGGTRSTGVGDTSTKGSDSYITGFTTAIGGGYGATQGQSPDSGGNGGSGGGSAGAGGTGQLGSAGGSGTAGQGNNGGRGWWQNTADGGAGGGGRGAAGGNGSGNKGGNGGVGKTWLDGNYYAGGGGGGSYSGSFSTGGTGGGGRGGNSTNAAVAGSVNTGGGGGGGSQGGNGGSGIVIIRYSI